MKNKMFLLMMMFVLIVLAACSPAAAEQVEPSPVVDADVPSDAAGGGSIELANECDPPGAGFHLLNFPEQGFCFIYPAEYDLFEGDRASSLTFYVRSLLNTEAPSFSIEYQAQDGRTLQEIAAQIIAENDFVELVAQDTTLGGEPAILIDNMPGQDTIRRVITIHNEVVFTLSVSRVGVDYGEVGEQAEALFSQITSTFEFIPVEKDKPLVAGPECPEQVEASLLYTNEVVGYCVLLPAGFETLEVSVDADNNEMAFYIESAQSVDHPHLWIKVTDAKGASLEEATMAHKAEIESAFEGFDVMYSFGYMLDGVPANQFDQVPGQDLSRQMVMVHDDRLFVLTFTPDDPEAGDVYAEMEAMYEMVLDSFSFLSK